MTYKPFTVSESDLQADPELRAAIPGRLEVAYDKAMDCYKIAIDANRYYDGKAQLVIGWVAAILAISAFRVEPHMTAFAARVSMLSFLFLCAALLCAMVVFFPRLTPAGWINRRLICTNTR